MSIIPLLAWLVVAIAIGAVMLRARRRRSDFVGADAREAMSAQVSFRPSASLDIDSSQLTAPQILSVGEACYLVLDTETFAPVDEEQMVADSRLPYSPIVALSWQILTSSGQCLEEESYTLRREGMMIPEAIAIHGITNEAMAQGTEPSEVYSQLLARVGKVKCLVAHHLDFHLGAILYDLSADDAELLLRLQTYCTMRAGTALGFKRNAKGQALYPRLDELFGYLYFARPHISLSYSSKTLRDVRLVSACLRSLLRLR